ncbi:MAG: hypothetical protein ABFQ89_01090 [Chloroflexota bacterium]
MSKAILWGAVLLFAAVAIGAIAASVLIFTEYQQVQSDIDSETSQIAQLENQVDALKAEIDESQERKKELSSYVSELEAEVEEKTLALTPELTPTVEASGIDYDIYEALDTIELQVQEIRKLDLVEPVTRQLFDRYDLAAWVERTLDEELSDEEEWRSVIELAAFELVDLNIDLRGLMTDLYTEQIGGFYDYEEEALTIIDDDHGFTALDKTVFVHELTHALQDQHYDLELLDSDDLNDDAALALASLIEGDATLTMQIHMIQYLDASEMRQLFEESMSAETQELEGSPPAIQAQLVFPYEAGFVFAQRLAERGGFDELDKAYADIPQSTEHILHPELYLAGEVPIDVSLPPLTDTLGVEWEYIDSNVLGEFGLRLFLLEQLEIEMASDASAGWGGDTYVVFLHQEDQEIVMLSDIVWDSEDEADEFVNAIVEYGRQRFGWSGDGDVSDGLCWSDDYYLCLFQSEDETYLVRAPSEELVFELIEVAR